MNQDCVENHFVRLEPVMDRRITPRIISRRPHDNKPDKTRDYHGMHKHSSSSELQLQVNLGKWGEITQKDKSVI